MGCCALSLAQLSPWSLWHQQSKKIRQIRFLALVAPQLGFLFWVKMRLTLRGMELSAAVFIITAFFVVDGDTLETGNQKIRLWGIDAPEAKRPGGESAKRALIAIIDGNPLTCEKVDVDRYGRTVARCDLPDGTDIACALVASGHAKDWPRYSAGHYADCAR